MKVVIMLIFTKYVKNELFQKSLLAQTNGCDCQQILKSRCLYAFQCIVVMPKFLSHSPIFKYIFSLQIFSKKEFFPKYFVVFRNITKSHPIYCDLQNSSKIQARHVISLLLHTLREVELIFQGLLTCKGQQNKYLNPGQRQPSHVPVT